MITYIAIAGVLVVGVADENMDDRTRWEIVCACISGTVAGIFAANIIRVDW